MKTKLITCVAALWFGLSAFGADITPGYTFTEGQQNVTASLVNQATAGSVNTSFLSTKTASTSPTTSFQLLLYDSLTPLYYRATLGNAVFDSVNLISNRTAATTIATTDTLLIHNGSAYRKITFGNMGAFSLLNGTGAYSTKLGTNNTSTGDYSLTGGQSSSTLTAASYSLAFGQGVIMSNSATHSAGFGRTITNTLPYTYSMGLNIINAGGVSLAAGSDILVSGVGSFGMGLGVRALGSYGEAAGAYSLSDKYGQRSQASGRLSTTGDAQTSKMTLRIQTTDSTPSEMFLDGASATKRMTISSDTTWTFSILVVARRTDADNESAAYKLEGCIDRNGAAITTAIVGSVTKTILAEDTAAWDVSATADATNGALIITVTGENAKTINWHAVVITSEISG